jgi:PDZ domain-containing protein
VPVSRRNLTLLLSSGLAVVLTVLAFALSVPYVLLSGGPVYNTTGSVGDTPVISISGRETFPTDGQLDLTTVSVDRTITLAEAIKGWFSRDQAVAPTELLYPPDKSDSEIKEESTQQMVESQSSATSAALIQLGIPVTVAVSTVSPTGPSAGKLTPGDVIAKVDGKPVTSPAVLRRLVGERTPGSPVTLSIERAGVPSELTYATADSGETPRRAIIGIDYVVSKFPFTVDISLANVGGPSAGLMFSLGIIDKLTPGSLTQGKHIAGTGEINNDGDVGPIGGIQQKMAAAREEDVDVFLVPDENCEAAQENKPDGLQLVRVTTLASALTALEQIRTGGTPQGCAS